MKRKFPEHIRKIQKIFDVPDEAVIEVKVPEGTPRVCDYCNKDLIDEKGATGCDIIAIDNPKQGEYLVNIIPEPEALSTDTYTLETSLDGIAINLAEDVKISDIPIQPYIVRLIETRIIPIIPATIDFDPDTLNLKNIGQWVTAYIELPVGHGYDVSAIKVESIMLNGRIQCETKPTEIGDDDTDGIPDLMVKFNRSSVQSIFKVGDKVRITITGEFTDGRLFEGKDTIKVISGAE